MPCRRREHRTERARRGAGGPPRRTHPDWEGSWRLASSPSRTATGDLAYSPYGAAYAGSGPNGFTGGWVVTPDNLDFTPNRLLAPMMDRWLSPDPAGIAAVNPANPQSWNAYTYVGGTPLEATDPTGLTNTPDPSALYTESQDYVLEATQGFEGGENEFSLGSIPVVYAGAQMSFVGNNGMPYSLFADGTNGWQYENDSNGELFNASLGGLELGLPAQPTMFFDSFLTSPLVISNALAQAVGQHIAALPPPGLSVRQPTTAQIAPGGGNEVPDVPAEWGFCNEYRDGTGAGSALYDVCMNFPNFPSRKWASCVRGKLLDQYVPDGNPAQLGWYLFADHPYDFVTCPVG